MEIFATIVFNNYHAFVTSVLRRPGTESLLLKRNLFFDLLCPGVGYYDELPNPICSAKYLDAKFSSNFSDRVKEAEHCICGIFPCCRFLRCRDLKTKRGRIIVEIRREIIRYLISKSVKISVYLGK